MVEHDAGGGPYAGVGVRHGDRPADQIHAAEVVDVVAHVGHAGGVQALDAQPVAQRGVLGGEALQDRHAELARAGGDDRVALGRQDQQLHARPLEQGDPEAVGAADGDRLAAVLVDVDQVVGVHAVEVGDHRVHVDRPGPVHERRERPYHLQVLGGVDLDGVARRHGLDGDGAEEPVAVLPQAGGADGVEGAGLAVLRLAVLAARAVGRVVVDPAHAAVAGGPHELVGRETREDDVGGPVEDLRDRGVQVGGVDEGARALDEHDDLGVRVELVERVQQGRLAGGGGAAQLGGALDHAGARGLGGGGDPLVVGADHDFVDQLGPRAGSHRAGDQGRAAHLGQVLERDARRTSTGGDDGQDSQGDSLICGVTSGRRGDTLVGCHAR